MSEAFPLALKRVIKNLSRLPGIGEKTATRLALFMLGRPKEEILELAESISELPQKIRLCKRCFNFAERQLCRFCSDLDRDQSLICVVEDPADLSAIEASKAFKGVYHVLHGLLSPRDGIGPKELRIEALIERIKQEPITEIVIALSPTVAGEATTSYLIECLKPFPIKITRLACGVPMGMDVKYADYLTLRRAIEARQRL